MPDIEKAEYTDATSYARLIAEVRAYAAPSLSRALLDALAAGRITTQELQARIDAIRKDMRIREQNGS